MNVLGAKDNLHKVFVVIPCLFTRAQTSGYNWLAEEKHFLRYDLHVVDSFSTDEMVVYQPTTCGPGGEACVFISYGAKRDR